MPTSSGSPTISAPRCNELDRVRVHVVVNCATLCPCAAPASNTPRLLENSDLVPAKLREEMDELLEEDSDIVTETADVLNFALVKSVTAGSQDGGPREVLDRREKPSPDDR